MKPGKLKKLPKESLFREAFLPDKKLRKPLLVREKQTGSGIGWGITVLWGIVIAVIVFTLFFSDFHTVRTISISGNHDIPSERIDAFVRDRLSGKRFRILPGDNFFLMPSFSIERDLLLEFPKLKSASVTRQFPDKVNIEISERDRILLWCANNSCVLVDDAGNAQDARFAETPENEPFLLRVIDGSARLVAVGEPLLSVKASHSIMLLERSIRDRGDIGITVPFHSPSRVSDEVRITTEQGWDLLVNLGIDPDKTIDSLKLVLEKEIPVERRSVLRYIDLRTENKAFFSYTDWTPPPVAPTTPTTLVPASVATPTPTPTVTSGDSKKK